MAIVWDDVQKAIFPIKNYEDICHRLKISLGYRFVHAAYNFSLPQLESYTQKLLGGDPRGRYLAYNSNLKNVIARLHKSGIENVVNLTQATASRQYFELLVEQSGIAAPEIAMTLKYLVYWVIPSEKYLSELVRNDESLEKSIEAMRTIGIRTNLELLQAGSTHTGRAVLADRSGLALTMVTALVNRADFSRLPWASKATISNIIGAGYGSLKELSEASPEQLLADFFRYGKSIGKNLKFGNEIESSFRIAKILPVVVK